MPNFCCGCTNCFLKGEEFCPHHEVVVPVNSAMEEGVQYIYGEFELEDSNQMKGTVPNV